MIKRRVRYLVAHSERWSRWYEHDEDLSHICELNIARFEVQEFMSKEEFEKEYGKLKV